MPERFVCVALHDVAAARWAECERVLQAVREVADIPLTLLVVPAYKGKAAAATPEFTAHLHELSEQGHELALHGYFHSDPQVPTGLRDWLKRRVYTAGEGEFSALDETEVNQRLTLGRRWFEFNNFPVHGFVPPAWLLGPAAWKVLRERGDFDYVTTLTEFHCLRQGTVLRAPCFTWSVRSGWRRKASVAWNSALLKFTSQQTVVRVALHPCDVEHASIRNSWQTTLASLLETRKAVTKSHIVSSPGAIGVQHHRAGEVAFGGLR